jgi:hypothetical protein
MPPMSLRRLPRAAFILVSTVLVTSTMGTRLFGPPASASRPYVDARQQPALLDAQKSTTGTLRSFRAGSYWNTPLGHAPRDPHNRRYRADSQLRSHTQNYLKLVLGDWGMPRFRSHAGDPVYRINPSSGPTVRVHIPRRARPMPTSDAALTILDRASHQVVCLGHAHFARSTHRWKAESVSRYWSRTNGIAQGLPGGSRGNLGHRGIPGSVQAVTKAEIRRGAIRHRLEVYWWETAPRTPTGREAYFPMTGSESKGVGTVPEGIVIRIKPSVDLKSRRLSPAAYTIARALQRYGAVVGDNSGTGNNLKLQANTDWTGILTSDSLRSIPWRDYVFVKGGYRP